MYSGASGSGKPTLQSISLVNYSSLENVLELLQTAKSNPKFNERVSDYGETEGISANLIKAWGDKNDSLFLSTKIKFFKCARDCCNEAKSSSICIGGGLVFLQCVI